MIKALDCYLLNEDSDECSQNMFDAAISSPANHHATPFCENMHL